MMRFAISPAEGLLRVLTLIAGIQMAASSVAFAQTASQPKTTGQTAVHEGNPENGKKLFAAYYCWSCHGSMGRAGGTAPAIAPSTRTAEQLIQYIRKPARGMPAYTSKTITDQEVADIAAFLKSVPPGPAAKDIPLLNGLNQ